MICQHRAPGGEDKEVRSWMSELGHFLFLLSVLPEASFMAALLEAAAGVHLEP